MRQAGPVWKAFAGLGSCRKPCLEKGMTGGIFMENCIFCKIAAKQIPATVVYEDESVLAFHDIHPVAPVHVLIIPKIHRENVMGLGEEDSAVLFAVHAAAKKVAEKLGIAEKGFRLITNCGPDAGQTVFHLHYHLIGGRDLGPKLL